MVGAPRAVGANGHSRPGSYLLPLQWEKCRRGGGQRPEAAGTARKYTGRMAPPRFRTRLFVTLSLFAVVPSAVLTLLWATTLSTALPLLSGSAAWERVAATGERAIAAARSEPLSPAARAAMSAHEQELTVSVTDAHRYRYMAVRSVPIVVAVAGGALIVLAVVASRVAGHLARQLSRPLDELVGWTDRIARAPAARWAAHARRTRVRRAPEPHAGDGRRSRYRTRPRA